MILDVGAEKCVLSVSPTTTASSDRILRFLSVMSFIATEMFLVSLLVLY